MISRTYYYHWRPIGDRHAWSENSTCFIGDRHAWSETDTPDRKPTCLIGDRHVLLETNMPYQRPTFMPVDTHWRPICIRSPIKFKYINMLIYIHVGIRWVVDQACQSPMGACRFQMGLRWSMWRSPMGMFVSDGSSIGHVGLRSGISVFDGSPINNFSFRWVSNRSPMGLR